MEYTAEEVYESFQGGNECRELVRFLLNSGLLADILHECADYVKEEVDMLRKKSETQVDNCRV